MTRAAVLVLLALAGCGDVRTQSAAPDRGSTSEPAGSEAAVSTDPAEGAPILVLAAASLTEAFETLAAAFQAGQTGAEVEFSFAGSQSLAGQIEQGLAADVFASANEGQMRRLADAGLTSAEPSVFASNRLAIVVEPGNPLGIKGLADLSREGLVLVLAAPAVPAGEYAAEIFGRAGVAVAPSSLETDVRGVLSKVALGEADAGIAYETDARAADVDMVAIPDDQNVVAEYYIAPLRDAPAPGGAEDFVRFVLSPAGREALAQHGFGAP
jgi:molybdate transport system substrate-binding protein